MAPPSTPTNDRSATAIPWRYPDTPAISARASTSPSTQLIGRPSPVPDPGAAATLTTPRPPSPRLAPRPVRQPTPRPDHAPGWIPGPFPASQVEQRRQQRPRETPDDQAGDMERRAPIAGRVADLYPVRRVGEHGQRHSDDHGGLGGIDGVHGRRVRPVGQHGRDDVTGRGDEQVRQHRERDDAVRGEPGLPPRPRAGRSPPRRRRSGRSARRGTTLVRGAQRARPLGEQDVGPMVRVVTEEDQHRAAPSVGGWGEPEATEQGGVDPPMRRSRGCSQLGARSGARRFGAFFGFTTAPFTGAARRPRLPRPRSGTVRAGPPGRPCCPGARRSSRAARAARRGGAQGAVRVGHRRDRHTQLAEQGEGRARAVPDVHPQHRHRPWPRRILGQRRQLVPARHAP